jgi:transposase
MPMRTIGLDVGRTFAVIAIKEDGRPARQAGRIMVSPADLRRFAATLGPGDQVVLEASTNTWAIAELLAEHAGRVVVSNPVRTRAIADAKTKTDEIDAAVLAELLAADYIPEVWQPDQATRELRSLVAHRAALVRSRTAQRNRAHAILARTLVSPPVGELFGAAGRRWLADLSLPAVERLELDAALRLHDALEAEVAGAERVIAEAVVDDARVRHLLSVPGIGLAVAASLVAVIGDVARFPRPNRLAAYLGLDPRVRQSGARSFTGHISRAGQAHARGLLIEAAHAAVRTPGPLHARYERIRRRRGAGVAVVAVARHLAVLAWHLLTRDADYTWSPPRRTAEKLRSLELRAGDAPHRSRVGITMGPAGTGRARRDAARATEHDALRLAEAAYEVAVRGRSEGAGAVLPVGSDSGGRHEAGPAARRGHDPRPPALRDGLDRARTDDTAGDKPPGG